MCGRSDHIYMRMTVENSDKCMSKGKVCVLVESSKVRLTGDTDDVTIVCRVLRLSNALFRVSEIKNKTEFIKAN
jgi:hypothetical protein